MRRRRIDLIVFYPLPNWKGALLWIGIAGALRGV